MGFVRSLIDDFSKRRKDVRGVIVVTFLLAAILALTASGTPYLRNVMAGKLDAVAEFWDDLLWMSIWLAAWLPIVPVIYVLAARLADRRATAAGVLGVYLGGFAFAYVVHVGIQVSAMQLPAYDDVHPNLLDAVLNHMLSGVFLIAVTYGGVAATCHAIAGHRRNQEIEMRRVRLESELVQARMQALRSQLHPHFLFNALNSVSTLMYRDVKAADDMLAGIGELLRVLIKDSDRHMITLREEMDFISMYLGIEKIRHGEDLHVTMERPPELDRALVPALILQPIVENAIKHGTSRKPGRGRIEVSAARSEGRLSITVSDDGPGFASGNGAEGSGVGISNLRARMAQLYGEDQSLTLSSSHEGAVVVITIPLRFEPAHAKMGNAV